jgi:hypothetical protein
MSDNDTRSAFRNYLATRAARTGFNVKMLHKLVARIYAEIDDLEYEECVRNFGLVLECCRRCGHNDLQRFDHVTFVSVYCKLCQESWNEERPRTPDDPDNNEELPR